MVWRGVCAGIEAPGSGAAGRVDSALVVSRLPGFAREDKIGVWSRGGLAPRA